MAALPMLKKGGLCGSVAGIESKEIPAFMTQRVLEITSPFFISERRLKEAGSIDAIFERSRPLALEIGCGIGDFIIQKAHQEPEVNFLAVDIYNKGCLKTCKKVDSSGMRNIRVMRMEARYLLHTCLAPESLSAVYINCPDPWPKKRHRGRRLVNREFLQVLLLYLKPGGALYFTTDFFDYAEDVAGSLFSLSGYENCQAVPASNHLPDYPLSKYMRRFLQEGSDLHFIQYRRKEDFTAMAEDCPTPPCGFRAPWSRVGNE